MRLCASLSRGVAAPLGCVICLQLGDVAVFSLCAQYFLNVRDKMCIRDSNSGIADGVSGLNAALGALAEQGISMVYDEVHMVLAEGNFVLAVSEGTFGGAPTSYYDLWRVENGKIAEHWDVMETIADQMCIRDSSLTVCTAISAAKSFGK